jgi:hypothetical protein
MTLPKLLVRVVGIAVVLSAVDAISGRVFHASVNPSAVLFLGAPARVAFRLARHGLGRQSWFPAMTLWVVYMASFVGWAALLTGWNRAVPWYPRSTSWVLLMGAWAFVIAIFAQTAGARARVTAEIRDGNSAEQVCEDDGLF